MSKIMYVYLNDNDLLNILNFFSENNINCINADSEEIKAVSNGFPVFYFGIDSETCINFSPCFYTLNLLQCAVFRIENDNEFLNSIFTKMKKYIKSSYRLSKDKAFYIGPDFYNEWKENKYCLPLLLEYHSFCVNKSYIKELFDHVSHKGFIVRNNNSRLRNINNLDLLSDSFVIYADRSKMIETILRKSIIRYECGSECIFAYKRKNGIYEFILDDRLYDNCDCSIVKIYDEIKEITEKYH